MQPVFLVSFILLWYIQMKTVIESEERKHVQLTKYAIGKKVERKYVIKVSLRTFRANLLLLKSILIVILETSLL